MSIQAPPLTLMERLSQLIGQPITVYLMGVSVKAEAVSSQAVEGINAETIFPPKPGPRPPFPPCPPCPPRPSPDLGTLVLTGILVGVGADYLIIRIENESGCKQYIIPFIMIGLILPVVLL